MLNKYVHAYMLGYIDKYMCMYVRIFQIGVKFQVKPECTERDSSRVSHAVGVTAVKMREQPGNSEHKRFYLPKAAHFRIHGANSCPNEVKSRNFDSLQ